MVMVKAGFSYSELMDMPGETFSSIVSIYHDAMNPQGSKGKVITYKVRRGKKTVVSKKDMP